MYMYMHVLVCLEKYFECLCIVQAHSLRQELGKVKAAHMKLVKEVQDREAQLAKSEEDRTRVLNEQKTHAEARYIQETRLQATIAQQSKLIDYLQKVGTISPRSGGLDKIKKVYYVYICMYMYVTGASILCTYICTYKQV